MIKRKTKKRVIEAGMLGTMAGMVGSGFWGGKKSHIAWSVAFMGFTFWHYTMYRPLAKKKKRPCPRAGECRPFDECPPCDADAPSTEPQGPKKFKTRRPEYFESRRPHKFKTRRPRKYRFAA